jgi:maltose O-acetyltransferase
VSIGANTVVGAGSVVVKDLPADVVAVGNPARIVRRLE